MENLHDYVRQLIVLNEHIQSHVLNHHAFTDDELWVIRACADELSSVSRVLETRTPSPLAGEPLRLDHEGSVDEPLQRIGEERTGLEFHVRRLWPVAGQDSIGEPPQ